MTAIDPNILLGVLKHLLMPVARFCIRHALKIQDFLEVGKAVFMRAAQEELERNFQEGSASRLSAMTGMHRRDVMRLKGSEAYGGSMGKGLIAKVVGQWRTKKKYLTKSGKPRPLTLGSYAEFAELVASVSQDLSPGAVYFELERVKAVTREGDIVKLNVQNYYPKGDVLAGFNIVERDTEDLICAVEENLFGSSKLPHLHLRTEYDRVRANASEKVKVWLLKEGYAFQVRVRDKIAKFDQDVNPDPKYKGEFIRVALGTFCRIK